MVAPKNLMVRSVVTIVLCLGLFGFARVVDLIKEPADIQIVGSVSPPFPIASIAAGDINGDGIDDLIMQGGFPTIVSVVFGAKNLHGEVRLSESVPPALVIENLQGSTFPPMPISIGDLNGDHIGDLLIPFEDGLQVVWGRKRWESRLDIRSERNTLRILAKEKVRQEGYATSMVTTGDINKDGIADLVLTRTVGLESGTGESSRADDLALVEQEIGWVFWGRKSWPNTIDLARQQSDVVLVTAQPKAQPRTLHQFAIGDLDGDGFGDIVVGAWDDVRGVRIPPVNAPWATAWIVPGRVSWPRRVELKSMAETVDSKNSQTEATKSIILVDAWPLGMFVGGGLAVADFVGDSKSDLIIGLVEKTQNEWRKQLCIIKGGEDVLRSSSLDLRAHCSVLSGSAGFAEIHPTFVPRPMLGDFNGDGRSDLFVVIVRPEFLFKGIWGRGDMLPKNLDIDKIAGVEIRTPGAQLGRAGYGFSMAMGDINGDKFSDLLIVDAHGGGSSPKEGGGGSLHIVLGAKN